MGEGLVERGTERAVVREGGAQPGGAAAREAASPHHRAGARLYERNGGEDGGYGQTTIEAMAAAGDISLRTFFRYFEGKADR